MDGLFEILFILLILLAPLLESLFRRRRGASEGDGEGPTPADRRTPTRTAERGRPEPGRYAGGERTSEGMIPPEIWEELTGITHPRKEEAATAEAGSGGSDDEVAWWEAREEEAETEVPVAAGEIGAEEIGAGEMRPGREPGVPARGEATEVTAEQAELAARFREAQAGRPAPGAPARRGGGRARRLLRGASNRELQDAIVLREVLGPPLALRE